MVGTGTTVEDVAVDLVDVGLLEVPGVVDFAVPLDEDVDEDTSFAYTQYASPRMRFPQVLLRDGFCSKM